MKRYIPFIIAVFAFASATIIHAQSLEFQSMQNLPGRTCIAAVENYVYTAGNNHFAIVDVTRPASPVLRGQLTPNASTINAVAVDGDYAYCAGNATGLVVIDVSNPASPAWTSVLTTGAPALGVAVHDTLVAVAGSNGVTLVGVRSTAHPHFLTRHTSAATWVEFDPSGTLIHVGSNQGARLLQINTSVSGGDTTFSLQQTHTYGTEHMTPLDLTASYVDAANLATLTVLNRTNYSLAGTYTAPAAIRAIAGGSNVSFLGLANAAVYCINQQTASPQFAMGVTTPGAPTGVAMASGGGLSLVVVSHSVGVSIYSYIPLSSSETPTHAVPDNITLSAYPNPFNSAVTVQMTIPRDGVYTLAITDLLGRLVSTEELTLSGSTSHRLDFSNHTAGVYLARLSGTTGTQCIKLLYLP